MLSRFQTGAALQSADLEKPMKAIGIAETGDMCVGFCTRQILLLRDLSGECQKGALFYRLSRNAYTWARALSKSAMMSSAYSMPTDSRMRSGDTPQSASC